MFRKFKFFGLFVVIISMAACSTIKDQYKETSDNGNSGKVDYKKAALLNIELGETYLKQGQVSRAKKKLLHALDLAPRLPEAQSAMGYFFETVGDNTRAEKYYRKAIALGKERGEFHNSYANFLCGQEQYQAADKEYLLAIKDYQYPKTAEAYENAGMCALKEGSAAKAENYFKTAVRYDAKQFTSLLELTELNVKKGEIAQAQIYLNSLRVQTEPTPKVLWLSIQIAQKTHDKNAEASDALLLKNLFANSLEYKLYLAGQKK